MVRGSHGAPAGVLKPTFPWQPSGLEEDNREANTQTTASLSSDCHELMQDRQFYKWITSCKQLRPVSMVTAATKVTTTTTTTLPLVCLRLSVAVTSVSPKHEARWLHQAPRNILPLSRGSVCSWQRGTGNFPVSKLVGVNKQRTVPSPAEPELGCWWFTLHTDNQADLHSISPEPQNNFTVGRTSDCRFSNGWNQANSVPPISGL